MTANRTSPIEVSLEAGAEEPVSKGTVLDGELLGELRELFMPFGRHFNTASTEALQGWTWSGYENMTRMTIAALAIVEAIEGMSTHS